MPAVSTTTETSLHGHGNPPGSSLRWPRRAELIVILFALLVFLPSLFSPPHLMDDEDAARAQISRNMIQSGDWVTPRLNGVRYF